jgi:hypothetical protein
MSFDPNDPVFLAAVAQAVAVAMQAHQQQAPAASPVPTVPAGATKPPAPANSVLSTTECPKIDQITLLQATQWDAGTKQPYKRRYKLCLEVWTVPEDQIKLSGWQWKRYVLLYNWKDFRNVAFKGLKRGTISQAYYDWIDHVTQQSSQHSHWFGLIGDKQQGTHYYNQQWVRVRIDADDKVEDMALLHTDDVLSIEHWSNKDCKGQRLKGNFTQQARLDRCEYGFGWATEAKPI